MYGSISLARRESPLSEPFDIIAARAIARAKPHVHPLAPLIPASFQIGRRWYVVYTNIRCEARANMGLKAKGFDTFYPIIRKKQRHARYTVVVERPLFVRYLFVRFDIERDEWFHPIMTTDGVEDLIRNDTIPVRIADSDLARIISAFRAGDFDLTRKRAISEFEEGEIVRIGDGVFSGFNARVVAAMPDKQRAEVLLSFLGRSSKIALDYSQLEKL